MIVLAAAAVLIVVVVLVGLALGLTSSRPSDGTTLLAIGGGALVVLVAGAVLLAGVGLDAGDDEDGASPEASAATTTTTTTTTTVATQPAPVSTTTRPARDEISVRDVAMHGSGGDEFTSPPSIVDRLSGRTVLRVTATGFEPWSTGVIAQCTTTGCGNAFPVSFDGNGAERLQYLAEDGFVAAETRASCGPDDPPCVVRVSGSGDVAYLSTVFGGPAPASRTVAIDTPEGGVADGDTVEVMVSGFLPGERVQAMLCAAPATFGAARCGAPGPVAPLSIDDDGTGRAPLVVRRGRVGSDGVACGRDAPCGVAVVTAGTFVPGPVAPITFAAGPTATYDSTRVLVGLLVAVFLLGLATYLARTTDWRKPTEADTPDLDRGVL